MAAGSIAERTQVLADTETVRASHLGNTAKLTHAGISVASATPLTPNRLAIAYDEDRLIKVNSFELDQSTRRGRFEPPWSGTSTVLPSLLACGTVGER